MSETTKKATLWTVLGAALLAFAAQNTERALSMVVEQAGWVVPMLASVVLSFGIPHRLKHLLPSASWIRPLSVTVGLVVYPLARWAWVMKAGEPYTGADLVLDALVALTASFLTPILYDSLPAGFRRKYSYTAQRTRRMKGVRTAAGEFEERPADQVSGEGEATVVPPYDRTQGDVDIGEPDERGHGYPSFLAIIGVGGFAIAALFSAAAALRWPAWWIVAGALVLLAGVCARAVLRRG